MLALSCQGNADHSAADADDEPPHAFVAALMEAHAFEDFHSHEAISFDLLRKRGDQVTMDARILSRTNSTAVRVEHADGRVLVYDGEDVYVSPDTVEYPGARFDMFTWQYFFMAPFKFNDPGTQWDIMEGMAFDSTLTVDQAGKLSFMPGTGDAPDDWYIAYPDPGSGLLKGLAYIVTFSRSPSEAEPHGITYSDYELVEGVPVATRWQFRNWSEEKGFFGLRGEAEVSHVRFVDADEVDFAPPVDARRIPR